MTVKGILAGALALSLTLGSVAFAQKQPAATTATNHRASHARHHRAAHHRAAHHRAAHHHVHHHHKAKASGK